MVRVPISESSPSLGRIARDISRPELFLQKAWLAIRIMTSAYRLSSRDFPHARPCLIIEIEGGNTDGRPICHHPNDLPDNAPVGAVLQLVRGAGFHARGVQRGRRRKEHRCYAADAGAKREMK